MTTAPQAAPQPSGPKALWPVSLVAGIILILFGIIAIASAEFTTLVAVAMLGWVFLFAGVTQIFHAFFNKAHEGIFLLLFFGLIEMAVGLLILVHPPSAAVSLTLLIGIFLIAEGAFRMGVALETRTHNWGWLVLSGLISLLLGVLISLGWPSTAEWVIGMFVGINFVTVGWWLVLFALGVKDLASRLNA